VEHVAGDKSSWAWAKPNAYSYKEVRGYSRQPLKEIGPGETLPATGKSPQLPEIKRWGLIF